MTMHARPDLSILLLAAVVSMTAGLCVVAAAPPAAPPAAPKTAAATPAQEKAYSLKPGARGTLCVSCHAAFQETLKLPVVHKPVKTGDCVGCHNPHASSHGMLLAAEPGAVCARCHASMAATTTAGARSVHAPVAQGACVKCHDPHASKNKGLQLQAGSVLCYSCHADIQKRVAAAQFKHSPVERDCLGCHDPHSSKDGEHLLKKPVPEVCTSCHRTDQPAFARQHMNYPVGKADCTSCHDPHGSSQRGMLWSTVHAPVANKMCGQCHQDAASPKALATKKTGLDLCRSCHAELVNGMLAKNRLHWPAVDRTGCLNCHNPHASVQPALLKKPPQSLCADCHETTVKTLETAAVKHAPAAAGECSTCHDPHASNAEFLFTAAGELALCANCHDYQKHSNHPLGGNKTDPRNPNVGLDCSSCHAPHASSFKAFVYENPDSDLCVQCHQGVRR